MRLAVDAPAERCPANSNALRISLDMAGLAAAAPYALTVVSGVGTSGSAHNLFAFHQGGPFAVASVQTATGSAALPSATSHRPRPRRPAALPPGAYRAMATLSATHPPVTGRFVCRPSTTSMARSRGRGGMSCG